MCLLLTHLQYFSVSANENQGCLDDWKRPPLFHPLGQNGSYYSVFSLSSLLNHFVSIGIAVWCKRKTDRKRERLNYRFTMDYFQKLSLQDTFSRVGHVFSRKWAVFLSITVLAYLLFFAASVMAIFFMASFINYQNGNGYTDPHTIIAALVDNAVYYAVICVADGAIIRAVTEMYVGQVPTVDSTLQHGLSKIYQLFCNAVLIGAGVGIPAVLILLFLVWISGGAQAMVVLFNFFFLIAVVTVVVVTYHTYPAIMVEDAGIVDSIKRSVDLSTGHRWYILSCIMVFAVTKFALHILCNVVAVNSNGAINALMQLLKLVISIVFATLGSM